MRSSKNEILPHNHIVYLHTSDFPLGLGGEKLSLYLLFVTHKIFFYFHLCNLY